MNDDTTVTFSVKQADGTMKETNPIPLADFTNGVTKLMQQDLEGKAIDVTEEDETVEYRTYSTEKLFVKFSLDALDKLMDDATVMRKIRIKADVALLPGEWDEQSKKLVTAINGN